VCLRRTTPYIRTIMILCVYPVHPKAGGVVDLALACGRKEGEAACVRALDMVDRSHQFLNHMCGQSFPAPWESPLPVLLNLHCKCVFQVLNVVRTEYLAWGSLFQAYRARLDDNAGLNHRGERSLSTFCPKAARQLCSRMTGCVVPESQVFV